MSANPPARLCFFSWELMISHTRKPAINAPPIRQPIAAPTREPVLKRPLTADFEAAAAIEADTLEADTAEAAEGDNDVVFVALTVKRLPVVVVWLEAWTPGTVPEGCPRSTSGIPGPGNEFVTVDVAIGVLVVIFDVVISLYMVVSEGIRVVPAIPPLEEYEVESSKVMMVSVGLIASEPVNVVVVKTPNCESRYSKIRSEAVDVAVGDAATLDFRESTELVLTV